MELTQIPATVINAMLAAVILGFIGPIAASWISAATLKTKVSPIFIGVSAYIIAELILRSSVLQFLSGTGFFTSLKSKELIYQLFLALTIVVFEELVRYLVVRFIYNKRATDEYACSLGINWGAAECIITLGLVYLSYYMSAKTINAGNFEVLSELEFNDLKTSAAYISTFSALIVFLDIIKAAAGVIMQVFYTFVITRGVANKTVTFCLVLTAIVHLLYIYIPTLLVLMPAGLIISALFCSLSATLLLYYMREAIRRAKYYGNSKNRLDM